MFIRRIEDLPNTEYNRRYGQEIVTKSNNQQKNLNYKELEWVTGSVEWSCFTTTVTFKDLTPYETSNGMNLRTLYEYRKRVLAKIKKRLSRSSSKWNLVLPIAYAQYEYEQGSFFKPITKSNSPHHIHGLIAVQASLANRLYNYESNELDKRLSKDLRSISTVSTYKIEPLRLDETFSWVNYMNKGKDINDLSFC